MKILSLFLIWLLPNFLFAQEVEKIADKNTHETYFVLKENRKIKHGAYLKSNFPNGLLVSGYYKMGVRDSVWHFYDYKGVLEQRYDFSKNQLIYYRLPENLKDKKFAVLNGATTSDVVLDQPPIPIGGETYAFSKIANGIKYPVDALMKGLQGKVIISVIIDSNGKATNHVIKQSLSTSCDLEALRVVIEYLQEWVPGMLSGKVVSTVYDLPISFRLN